MKTFTLTALVIGAIATASVAIADGRVRDNFRGPIASFADLDTNGDGEISRAEMAAPQVEKFDNTDADGDGNLTVDEMLAVARTQLEAMVANKDQNGDGMLSAEEFKPKGMDQMFDRADADGDGKISREEWDDARRHMNRGPRGNN